MATQEWHLRDGHGHAVLWLRNGRTMGVAYVSPLTGAWLIDGSHTGGLMYADALPATAGERLAPNTRSLNDGRPIYSGAPMSARARRLTGARMAVLGGNGHLARGHAERVEVYTLDVPLIRLVP